MAKKTKLDLDSFDMDAELDFGDFNFDDVDNKLSPDAKNTKSRNPVIDVFAGAIGGAKDRFKEPSFLAKVVKDSLPNSYGETLSTVDEIAGSVSSLYDDAVKEIKPQLSRIAKKVDKLVPAESKFLKGITTKFKNLVGDETSDIQQDSKKQIEDQSILNSIGSVFGAQMEAQEEVKAKEAAESKIQASIEGRRFSSSFGLLSSISSNTSRMISYTERITQSYQKKSLELQFRSYFALTDIAQTTAKSFEVFKAQNDAIAKNTALPEFVKISNSERFKELAKNKFFGGIQDSLYGDGSFIKKGMTRLKGETMKFVGGLKNGMEQGIAGLEGIESLQEMNAQMAELGVAPQSKASMAGTSIGAWGADKVGGKISSVAKSMMGDHKGITDFGHKASNAAMNPAGFVDKMRRSDEVQNNMYSGGMKGKAANAADWLLSMFTDQGPDMTMDKTGGMGTIGEAAIFNNKTQTSITDIIPGYLARIYREISVLRTGDNATGLTKFDFNSGKFLSKQEMAADIKSRIAKKIKSSGMDYQLDKMQSTMSSEAITPELKHKTKSFYSQLANVPNMDYTPENIKNSRLFASLDAETAKHIGDSLDSKVTNSTEKHKGQAELTKGMMGVRDSTADFRGEIEMFIKAGLGDVLQEQGLVKQDESGTYKVDEDAYYKMVRDEGIVRSDINVKQGIKLLKPKNALESLKSGVKSVAGKAGDATMKPRDALAALKKTKIYNWKYKQGKGDDIAHTGPMAQDVNQNMGEDAAPGGKSLDLVNMNGNTMAAVKALQEQQQAAMKGPDTGKILQGIKDDTAAMIELMNKGGGFGGGGGSGSNKDMSNPSTYKDIIGGIASSAIGLAGKIGTDIFTSTKAIFSFGKDKVAKPAGDFISSALKNNKDKIGETFKSLFGKAGDMAASVLDVGKDIVMNKLPAGFKQLATLGNKAKDKIGEWLNGPVDLYIKGITTPIMKANLMKMGYYRDQATGKVIKTLDDLKSLKGNIVNQAGDLIVSIEELGDGLFDRNGQKIKSTFSKIATAVVGSALKGLQRGKNALKSMINGAAGAGGSLIDKVKGGFSKMKDSVSGMGGDKSYAVLVEIRDILKGQNDTAAPSTIEDKESNDGPAAVAPAPAEARYQGGNAIDGIMGMAGKVKGMLSGDKADYAKRKAAVMAKRSLRTAGKTGAGVMGKLGGWKGKALGGIAGLFNSGKGGADPTPEAPAAETPVAPQERQTNLQIATTNRSNKRAKKLAKRTGGKKAFNDRDGSGRRDGSWEDRLEENENRKNANKKAAGPIDLTPKYKSDKNIIDTMMAKASGLMGMIGGGFSGILGKAGDIFGSASDLLSLKGGKGLLGKLGKGALNVVKNPMGALKNAGSAVKGMANMAKGIRGASMLARGASILNTARTVATVGSLAMGGSLGTIASALTVGLTGLGTILASPVVLGAIAVAAVGYGGYKLYKYANRDNVDEFEDIRMKQYGIGFNTDVAKFNHHMLQLEAYLSDGRVGYSRGNAYLITKSIEGQEILDIFGLDKADDENVKNFNVWFGERFKPFFLTHLTALFSVNPKVKLKDVKSMKNDEKVKYLTLSSFESGPHDVSVSPFKDLAELQNNKTLVTKSIEALILKIGDKKSAGKDAKIPVLPEKAQQSTNRSGKDDALQSTNPKTTIDTYKKADVKVDLPTGEDGAMKESARPQETGSISSPSAAGLSKADGPLSSGEGAGQFMRLNAGVSLDGINPAMLKNFKAMVQEYGEKTGKSVVVTSGSRTSAQQEALYRKDPKKAAKPGRSLHEFGLAMDVNSVDLNALDELGLMRKYGFTRPIGGETWHMEAAGIQRNLQLARSDSNFATMAIEDSLGKGGGGIGSIKGSKLGTRDQEYAMNLIGASAKTVKSDKDKTADMVAGGKPQGKADEVVAKAAPSPSSVPAPAPQGKAAAPVAEKGSIAKSMDQSDKYSKGNELTEVDSKVEPGKVGPADEVVAGGDVKSAVAVYSKQAGMDPNVMKAYAAVESSMNPNAKAGSSSASGLYQFTSGTWDETIGKYGRKYKLDANASPHDVKASTLMASEYAKYNMNKLKSVKPNPNITDIYISHFLGLGGARKFLSADPSAIGATILPSAAKSNPSIFYKNGKALTVGEIYSLLEKKVSTAASQFGISLPAGSGLPTASANDNTKQGTATESASAPSVKAPAPSSGATISAETSSGRASSPDSITTSNQSAPSAKAKGMLSGSANTALNGVGSSDAKASSGASAEAMGTISTTLNQSLAVQTEILSVLKNMLKNAASGNNAQAQGGSEAPSSSPVDNRRADNRVSAPASAIDLRRKMT